LGITVAPLQRRHGARGLACGLFFASICAVNLPAFAAEPAAKDFEVLFSGNAHIQSFTYMHPGSDNWIDSTVWLESRILRYKRNFLVFQFENETDMGKRTPEYGIFDPNRGRWTFELGSRTEFSSQFFDVWLRHDCYHGIDRFYPGQDYKGMSEGVGFGSLGYLPAYRFKTNEGASGLSFPFRLDYYLNPMVYAPHGEPWQRHPYLMRLAADLRLNVLRWNKIGIELESLNVVFYARTNELQFSHLLKLDAIVYGTSAAMVAFLGWWPYDDQLFRNRAGKAVFGLELNL
jgi:hypothetical protein